MSFLYKNISRFFLLVLVIINCSLIQGCSFSPVERVTFYNAASGQYFEYEISKNIPFPCLYTDSEGIVYGAIYPYTLELTKEDGFAASVLYSLYAGTKNGSREQAGKYLATFNWSRFMEECRKLEDPWKLNKSRIMKDIASGSFSKNDLK